MLRSSVDRVLLGLSLVAAVLYFAAGVGNVAPEAAVVAKGLAIPALAAIAWRRQATLLASALLLHGLGDVLLEWRFLAGMAAFLIGHAVYVILFWRERRMPASAWALARVAAVGLVGLAAMIFLARDLAGVLAVAVPLYAVALLAMASSAQLSRRGQPLVSVGALLFVASDLLLGLDRFGGWTGGAGAVWPTYWLAQLLLTAGWLGAAKSSGLHQGQPANAAVS
jgi:uncharacterized membrane protein YhhN